MKITLARDTFTSASTTGVLSVDGSIECFTLEDVDRHLETHPDAKVPGATAIPRGTYTVIVDWSPCFGMEMPHVLNVPGYDGIRIHPGNADADTEGCILVGRTRGRDYVGQSRAAFNDLLEAIELAYRRNEPITLTVE